MTVNVSSLARSTTLDLPSGLALETPLLIPSFSSRGFPFEGPQEARTSALSKALEVAQDWINDVLLVSAYDLYHGHLPYREALHSYPPTEPFLAPALLILDSGVYEADARAELPDASLSLIEVREWDQAKLEEVIEGAHSDLSVGIVNYDRRAPIAAQIESARAFFRRRPGYLHDFLVKPPSAKSRYVDVNDIIGRASDFRGFSMIGFTEKELGATILTRMESIARIRSALDDAGVHAPIHVFGSLDPVLSPLYFLAGAEIFDGLSWLYLSYHEGVAMYGEAAAALARHWGADQVQRRSVQMLDNLLALSELNRSMRRFLVAQDFAEFPRHGALFREARENLRTKVETR